MVLLVVLISIAALPLLTLQAETVYNSNYKGRYVIVNRLTGNLCYGGRVYRTQKGAFKAAWKLYPFEDINTHLTVVQAV